MSKATPHRCNDGECCFEQGDYGHEAHDKCCFCERVDSEEKK